MGEQTKIGWTQKTWNPWRGCTRVSPGCAHCYAEKMMSRTGFNFDEVTRTKTWADPIRWQRKAEQAGRTELVFTCSWSDWFHEAADQWRPEAWEVVRKCPNLIFQILTKRPENIRSRLPADWGHGYPNVWLGVSAENQSMADKRIPLLLQAPAAVRFISLEPLLGPVELDSWPFRCWLHTVSDGSAERPGLDWVILGGESGPGFRPMPHAWAREIREQCRVAGVAFFFKQSAAPRTEMGTKLDGKEYKEYPRMILRLDRERPVNSPDFKISVENPK